MSIRTYFENIADAIKDKNPNVTNVTPAEMPSAIRSIPTGSSSASGVTYNNTTSGLTASNVQDAIDEISSDLSELSILKMSATPYSAKPNEFATNTFSYVFILGQNVGLETVYGPLITYAWYDASVVNSVCQVFIGTSIHVRRNASATTWGAWS